MQTRAKKAIATFKIREGLAIGVKVTLRFEGGGTRGFVVPGHDSRLGQVVTREVCLDTLWWGLELTDTRTLDTHVKRLRQKIEDDPANPRHLLTIRGVGFRLDA